MATGHRRRDIDPRPRERPAPDRADLEWILDSQQYWWRSISTICGCGCLWGVRSCPTPTAAGRPATGWAVRPRAVGTAAPARSGSDSRGECSGPPGNRLERVSGVVFSLVLMEATDHRLTSGRITQATNAITIAVDPDLADASRTASDQDRCRNENGASPGTRIHTNLLQSQYWPATGEGRLPIDSAAPAVTALARATSAAS